MLLSEENWESCTVHAVVHAFLSAEWDKWPRLHMNEQRRIVNDADLDDPAQNNFRERLLRTVRGPMLKWIPSDTAWFRVKFLREVHFGQLRVINHHEWRAKDDSNELETVAVRKPIKLRGSIASWDPPILWSHDEAGPFTILEGNNRLTALAGCEAQRCDCAIEVYVGLSRELCCWHLPDWSVPETWA